MDLFEETQNETHVVLDSRDQNDFKIARQDPFGFFFIAREKGLVPVSLRGQYTRKETAISAIRDYLETFALPRPIKEIVTKTVPKKA